MSDTTVKTGATEGPYRLAEDYDLFKGPNGETIKRNLQPSNYIVAPDGCNIAHATKSRAEWLANAHLLAASWEMREALEQVELACANAGIKLDKAFVWSKGDGSQSGGFGERVYLLDTIRKALARSRGEE